MRRFRRWRCYRRAYARVVRDRRKAGYEISVAGHARFRRQARAEADLREWDRECATQTSRVPLAPTRRRFTRARLSSRVVPPVKADRHPGTGNTQREERRP